MSSTNITEIAAAVAAMRIEQHNLKSGLDSEFLIRATTLIFTMQLGFVMLEGGFVRRLNLTNIVTKNVADFGIGAIAFFFIGWGLSGLSPSRNGVAPSSTPATFAGPGPFALVSDSEAALFQFHFAFASTASTIVSGGCAERIRWVGGGSASKVVGSLDRRSIGATKGSHSAAEHRSLPILATHKTRSQPGSAPMQLGSSSTCALSTPSPRTGFGRRAGG